MARLHSDDQFPTGNTNRFLRLRCPDIAFGKLTFNSLSFLSFRHFDYSGSIAKMVHVEESIQIARDFEGAYLPSQTLGLYLQIPGFGESSQDCKWPNNARIAVSFVLNYEEGGERSYQDGDGFRYVDDDPSHRQAFAANNPIVSPTCGRKEQVQAKWKGDT